MISNGLNHTELEHPSHSDNSFTETIYRRLKYFLSPQLDLYKNISDIIIEPLRKKQFVSILDYGCGTGFGSMILKKDNSKVYGIDSDYMAINFAMEVFGHLVEFKMDDWQKKLQPLYYNPDSLPKFDIITCIEVIEHIKDPHLLLLEFRNRLATNGVLILSTLNHNSQYRKNNTHISKYQVSDFKELMSDVFENTRITDYKLESLLLDDSTITPMIAICEV